MPSAVSRGHSARVKQIYPYYNKRKVVDSKRGRPYAVINNRRCGIRSDIYQVHHCPTDKRRKNSGGWIDEELGKHFFDFNCIFHKLYSALQENNYLQPAFLLDLGKKLYYNKVKAKDRR